MVASTLVYEGGKVTEQPAEVTYRNITYYYDQAIAEIVKSNSLPAASAEGWRAEDDSASLRGSLDAWIAATNARDLEAVMKFYGPQVEVFYRARNVSQEIVREDKSDSFGRVEAMQVSAGVPEITISGDGGTATMRFTKKFAVRINGRERRGEVLQLLQWQRTGEGWKIVGERDIRILRRG
jgi:ketosteroid isomerase-like protein